MRSKQSSAPMGRSRSHRRERVRAYTVRYEILWSSCTDNYTVLAFSFGLVAAEPDWSGSSQMPIADEFNSVGNWDLEAGRYRHPVSDSTPAGSTRREWGADHLRQQSRLARLRLAPGYGGRRSTGYTAWCTTLRSGLG
jgi:hypothetical protein